MRLGAGNRPAAELWEVVNLSPEAHNFHMHQSKFRVVDVAEWNPRSPYYTRVLTNREEFGQFQMTSMDNVALPAAARLEHRRQSETRRLHGRSGSCRQVRR